MAGHSKFKNIMYRKGAQDAKRAKVFTKIIREITVAARAGMPDPAMNAGLRIAISAAKTANMGKDTIARAIKRGSGGADDCESSEDGHEITCAADRLGDVRDSLENSVGLCRSAALEWKPQSTIPLEAEDAEKILNLMEALEDCDDVRTVSANFDISDELMEKLSA